MKTIATRRNRDLYDPCDVIIKTYADWSITPCTMNNKLNGLTPVWNKIGEDTTSLEGTTLYILKTTIPDTITTILFSSNTELYSVEYIKGKVTTLNNAFYLCINLHELHLNDIDVSECTSLSTAFAYLGWGAMNMPLEVLEWDTWDLSNCTNLMATFRGCRHLSNDTFKLLKTIKKINAYNGLDSTFAYCEGLTDANFALNWDISEYNRGISCFYFCINLTDISALSTWNTLNTIGLNNAFLSCTSLEDFSPLKTWDTSKVTNMNSMFSGCSNIKNVDFMHNWNLEKVTNIGSLFYGCTKLENINGVNFSQFKNVTVASRLLQGCSTIKDVMPLKYFDSSKCTDLSYMFAVCTSLDCDINTICNKLVQSACVSILHIFNGCTSLTCNMKFSGWDTLNVLNFNAAFASCPKVKIFDLSTFDTSKVTSFYYCFYNCEGAEVINVENWNTESAIRMDNMFLNCKAVKSLNLRNWHTPNVINMTSMFFNTLSLEEFDISGFDTSNVTIMQQMFYGCHYEHDIDLRHFNTSNVTNFRLTFMDSYFTYVNVSTWDTRKATSMHQMFCDIIKMRKVDISNFRWDTTCDCSLMFYHYDFCALLLLPLLEIDLTNVDTTNWTPASFGGYTLWRFIPLVLTIKLSQSWFNNSSENVGNFAGFGYSCMRDWTRDSIMESLYTNLIGRDTTRVIDIKIHRLAYDRLSEEDRSLICSNGFTISRC